MLYQPDPIVSLKESMALLMHIQGSDNQHYRLAITFADIDGSIGIIRKMNVVA